MEPITIAYVGNFRPPHSTENHVRAALERLGHTVEPLQEDERDTWVNAVAHLESSSVFAADPDLVLWTRTGWDWPHTPAELTHEEARAWQLRLLDACQAKRTPTVGFHLDRWWGLDREGQLDDEPFFRCDLVCTAEGGRPWADRGINHLWTPPGVLLAECERPVGPRAQHRWRGVQVAWVGSWRSYHPEWQPYRQALVDHLLDWYGPRRAVILPRPGQPLRGSELTDLYGTVPVIVGDSCLAGGATHYWSDRVPETIGRGGFLIHPEVDGLGDHYAPGAHLATYPLGDWDALHATIEAVLHDPETRAGVARAGRGHVMACHTYEARMTQVLAACQERGLL